MGREIRILLFVEPYCVRSGPDDFRTPFELFRRLAATLGMNPGVETALICSTAQQARPGPPVRFLTPAAFGVDEAPERDWQEKWVRMLRDESVAGWSDFYRQAVREFRPTLAYAWNKNSSFVEGCRRAGAPVITFEYGGCRAPSGFRISVDPGGFGPESALATTPFEANDADAESGWEWAGRHLHRDVVESFVPDGGAASAGRLRVCVLLQKEDDVNFLLWPSFGSMREFVEQTLASLTACDGVQVTLRPHPAGLEDYRPLVAERFARVHVDDGSRDFYQSLLNYDCLLTLNSAAGFEALACGVPVLTFSAGFYDCGTRAANGAADIAAFVQQVRRNEYWSPQRRRQAGAFLHRLVNHYSIPQDMLLEAGFHVALARELSGLSVAAAAEWFERRPARLAELVAQCGVSMGQAQISTLKHENHLKGLTLQRIDRRLESELAALLEQNHRHGLSFGELNRRVESIAQSVGQLAQQNHLTRESLDALARRLDGLAAALEALGAENHAKNLSWTDLTQANAQRDERLAELERQNHLVQQAQAAQAEVAQQQRTLERRLEQLDAALDELQRGAAVMRSRLDELAIPFVLRWMRRRGGAA
ncbi:MAG: hypothetical protein CHACPFDD_03591 [Phycisphaerae bacterium]|nr:hypothetical protein [Phycisphaerae bacterium]